MIDSPPATGPRPRYRWPWYIAAAFILAVVACLLMLLAGFPLALDAVRGLASQSVVDAVSAVSFLTHFQAITRGVLELRDVVFFVLAIAAWLLATVLVIAIKKGD